MKSALLSISPSTNVQNSETVMFYAPLFMILIHHYQSAVQFLKIFIREICYDIRSVPYIVTTANFGIDCT
jgi:hypothetical protein